MSVQQQSPEILPYGDRHADGAVQLSFTLPVGHSPLARRVALRLLERMGLNRGEIVHSMALTDGFTYFVAYAQCSAGVRLSDVADGPEEDVMSKSEVEAHVRERLGRRLVVVGASTGTDAHSLGIDAMLNMKGFNGEPGLEAYSCFEVHNLGSQVSNGALVEKAIAVDADAILVSQTVTQQKLHVHNLTQLVDIAESQGIRERVLLVCGGPRISDELAKELGFDAGFSKGCHPNHLASFLARAAGGGAPA